MRNSNKSSGLRIFFVSLLLGPMTGCASAGANFDGFWLVEVVAMEGDCQERTISLEVQEGQISFAGFGATAQGAIGSNGLLRASISRGGNVVRARGALSGASGHGSWKSGTCSGHWTARRG